MKAFSLLPRLIFSLCLCDAIGQAPPPCPTTRDVTYISRVRLGSINNSTTSSQTGVVNYRHLSTNLTVGSSYTISLTSSAASGFSALWNVSIDYNQNGSTSDAGEFVGTSTVATGSTTSITFTPPANAFNGTTLMRVVLIPSRTSNLQQSDKSACPPPVYIGETEEYSVNLSGGFCYSHGISSASDYISNVTVGNLSNNSGNDGGYKDFTIKTASLTSGLSYIISMSRLPSSSSRREYWSVYIDYNSNRVFEANERVVITSGTNTATSSFTVPFLTPTGNKRMRVMMSYNTTVTDPCAAIAQGEVEDYTVKILPPILSDGKISPDKLAAIGSKEAFVSVSPNPSQTSAATIVYTVQDNGVVFLRISDMSGRIVSTITAGNKTAGTYTYPLPSSASITAGTYMLTVEQNGSAVARSKFIIVK